MEYSNLKIKFIRYLLSTKESVTAFPQDFSKFISHPYHELLFRSVSIQTILVSNWTYWNWKITHAVTWTNQLFHKTTKFQKRRSLSYTTCQGISLLMSCISCLTTNQQQFIASQAESHHETLKRFPTIKSMDSWLLFPAFPRYYNDPHNESQRIRILCSRFWRRCKQAKTDYTLRGHNNFLPAKVTVEATVAPALQEKDATVLLIGSGSSMTVVT